MEASPVLPSRPQRDDEILCTFNHPSCQTWTTILNDHLSFLVVYVFALIDVPSYTYPGFRQLLSSPEAIFSILGPPRCIFCPGLPEVLRAADPPLAEIPR